MTEVLFGSSPSTEPRLLSSRWAAADGEQRLGGVPGHHRGNGSLGRGGVHGAVSAGGQVLRGAQQNRTRTPGVKTDSDQVQIIPDWHRTWFWSSLGSLLFRTCVLVLIWTWFGFVFSLLLDRLDPGPDLGWHGCLPVCLTCGCLRSDQVVLRMLTCSCCF